jgi:ankyrin repeat protein
MLEDRKAENGGELTSDDKNELLLMAATFHFAEATKTLLESGADPNSENEKGSALILAIKRSPQNKIELRYKKETINNLLGKGANPNVSDPKTMLTPLMYAAILNDAPLIKLLLDNGANIDDKDTHKLTALQHAVIENSETAYELLTAKGADIETKDERGFSALFLAVVMSNEQAYKFFVEHNAIVDTTDNQGNTPLIVAALYDNMKARNFLLKNNADIHLKNIYKESAFDIIGKKEIRRSDLDKELVAAVKTHNFEKVEELLNDGADPNTTDDRGVNVMYIAAGRGYTNIVDILEKSGADIDRVSDGSGSGSGSASMAKCTLPHCSRAKVLVLI